VNITDRTIKPSLIHVSESELAL